MKVKSVKEFKPDRFIIVNSSFKITSADSGRKGKTHKRRQNQEVKTIARDKDGRHSV